MLGLPRGLNGLVCFRPRILLAIAVSFCFLSLSPTALDSKAANAGSVSGVVTDSSGAVIVGAVITLTDKATNLARTTATNEAGRYVFANIPPGDYELDVNKSGFRTTKSIVTVTVGVP